jgi:hypothetical protein
MLHARAVHRVAGGEVVAAVQHDAAIGDRAIEIVIEQLFLQRNDLHFGIEGVQRLARLVDFRRADRAGAVQDLPLQVGEVDLVRVGEGELADAARREVKRRRAAEAAGADDQGARRAQPLLALDPDFGKKDVAAVAEELLVVQLAGVAAGFVAATDGGCFTGSPLR